MTYSKTLALNTDWDLAVTQRDDDLFTLTVTCDHRMNYQLVRTGLLSTKLNRPIENPLFLDWSMYRNINSNFQLLAPMIAALINSFEHISSINLQEAEYELIEDFLIITGICFQSDCDTSNTVCVAI